MSAPDNLQDAFVEELRDSYDAEHQLLKALPAVAAAASSSELRAAVEMHAKETQGHVDRLDRVFALVNETPRRQHCAGIAGILKEGESALNAPPSATTDALLIAGAQRVEHYEIAAYGTLVAWAGTLGLAEAAELLEEILEEEKLTDEKLTELATSDVNESAYA